MDKNIQDIKLLKRIEDIGLPDDIAFDLRWNGNIKTLKKLLETDVVDLLKIYGIGDKKVETIISTLNEMGLSIADSRKPKSPPKINVRKLDFPYNLLAYISEQKTTFNCPETATQDIIDGIHFACLSLNDKQQAALYLRFECHQTLEKIGVRFSLTNTQISNIINTAILSWFKTDKIKYIEYGLKGYVNYLVVSKAKTLAGALIREEYNRGYTDGYNEAQGIQIENKHNNDAVAMPIENLNLSVRAYNCIKRAKIDTVADLILKTEEEMMKVRNLGRKSFEEVREILHKMGLSFREDEKIDCISQKTHNHFVKQVTFSEVCGIFCHRTETSASIEDDGKIVAKKSIDDGYEYKYCTYEIPLKVWENFIDEAVILNDIINWKQEDFEMYEDGIYVEDDTTYNLKVVLGDNTIELTGGTESKGIRLIKSLFDKFLAPTSDVQYITEIIDDVF